MTTAASAPARYLQSDALAALTALGMTGARAQRALDEAQYGDTLGSYDGARPVSLYGVTLTWDRGTDRFTITPDDDEDDQPAEPGKRTLAGFDALPYDQQIAILRDGTDAEHEAWGLAEFDPPLNEIP